MTLVNQLLELRYRTTDTSSPGSNSASFLVTSRPFSISPTVNGQPPLTVLQQGIDINRSHTSISRHGNRRRYPANTRKNEPRKERGYPQGRAFYSSGSRVKQACSFLRHNTRTKATRITILERQRPSSLHESPGQFCVHRQR